MSSEKYADVDIAIIRDLQDRPRTGYPDWYFARKRARDIHQYEWDRVLDRRLQALRKKGEIVCKGRTWMLTEAPNEQ